MSNNEKKGTRSAENHAAEAKTVNKSPQQQQQRQRHAGWIRAKQWDADRERIRLQAWWDHVQGREP